MGRIGSKKLVLPKWHKYGTLDRVIRVSFENSFWFCVFRNPWGRQSSRERFQFSYIPLILCLQTYNSKTNIVILLGIFYNYGSNLTRIHWCNSMDNVRQVPHLRNCERLLYLFIFIFPCLTLKIKGSTQHLA